MPTYISKCRFITFSFCISACHNVNCLISELCHLSSPPLKGNKEEAVPETIEEAVEAAIEEAAAEEVTEQGAAPIASVEQEPTVTEEETASAPTQQEPAVVEDETAAAPTQQEPAPSTDAASEQVEPLNTEPAEETLEETSPVLEASSDNIIEELASAAEDWSELTARKPEETEVESAPEVKRVQRLWNLNKHLPAPKDMSHISLPKN
ncbi:hypothetical protein GDO81_000604 [Engystomops pustulosus]|uniref:Uncharacterized protein n=1 Tax=Engystomops pustulosus TaxID=76066 RepID=A0AAV7D5L7_ENGPU|nr:hypothetical protein GDO81_000604 [Engystomops pustulosus]